MTAQAAAAAPELTLEDAMRADLYGFLAALLVRPPSREMLDRAAALRGDGTEIGRGIAALARLAGITDEASARREFNALFVGLGRGELLPFASYYLTGFLNEKPLAALRADMARLGVERTPDVKEPEDNIASLCEVMAGLIRGEFGEPASLAEQKRFFEAHLARWAGHFFEDLEKAEGSVLYAPVGTIGRAFVEVEREAFRL